MEKKVNHDEKIKKIQDDVKKYTSQGQEENEKISTLEKDLAVLYKSNASTMNRLRCAEVELMRYVMAIKDAQMKKLQEDMKKMCVKEDESKIEEEEDEEDEEDEETEKKRNVSRNTKELKNVRKRR